MLWNLSCLTFLAECHHSMDKKRILIADDQADVLEALRFLLKAEGYQTEAVSSPAAVIHALETRDYDALIMDLNYTRDTTSGQEGLDLLGKIQSTDPTIPIIVMTAWGSVELARSEENTSELQSQSNLVCR